MLKKLLKYELPAIFKFLSIFYGLSILFSLLTRLFLGIENSLVALIIGEICRGAAISMLFSALINNFMRLWVRFRQNLYGDESYLTHTLPVPREGLYAAKMLTALITLVASMLVIFLSLFIMFYSATFMESVKNLFLTLTTDSDISLWAMIPAVLVLLFLEFVNMLQCGFTGIIWGHKMTNKKIGYSVLFGFVVYMAVQMVVLLAMLIMALANNEFMQLFTANIMPGFTTMLLVIWLSAAVYGLLIAALWLINTRLLKKGVDVE